MRFQHPGEGTKTAVTAVPDFRVGGLRGTRAAVVASAVCDVDIVPAAGLPGRRGGRHDCNNRDQSSERFS